MKINIPQQVADSPHRNSIFEEHFLQAWLYTHSDQVAFDVSSFKEQWLKQISLNQDQNECAELLFQNWPMNLAKPIFIKGHALEKLGLYQIGERFKSDIDLLIDQESSSYLESKIKAINGHEIKEKKWWGNSHKKIYSITHNNHEIVIECHSQLFYHLPQIDWQKYRNSQDPDQLQLEAHLLFLMGHYVFQHNCLKLYWLLDIALFIEKYSNQIDWYKLQNLASEWDLKVSLEWSLSLAHELANFSLEIPKGMMKRPSDVDFNFAWQTQQSGFNYWKMKHKAKGKMLNSLKYDVKWLLNKARK